MLNRNIFSLKEEREVFNEVATSESYNDPYLLSETSRALKSVFVKQGLQIVVGFGIGFGIRALLMRKFK